jgi:transcriptional regulator with XRE-family HTH domain
LGVGKARIGLEEVPDLKLARTKEWRESLGLTQRGLAAEAGVGEATVARIETGASVTPPTARKIAEALDVVVADLLEQPPRKIEVGVGDEPEDVPKPRKILHYALDDDTWRDLLRRHKTGELSEDEAVAIVFGHASASARGGH